MPSPFPGMDPYLEGSLWTTFHFALGAEAAVYDLLGYDLALDDTQPPDVAIEGEAVLLADALLQAAGKRQA